MPVMIFTDKSRENPMPDVEFYSIEAAKYWVQNNTGEFENQENICIVDFTNLKVCFMQARMQMQVEEV